MKLSKHTIEVLKNFKVINPSIFVKGGNIISTRNIADTVLANATVTETFPNDFGIYDLGVFLNTVSLFDDPTLDFSEEGILVIKEAESETQSVYRYSDEDVIIFPEEDSIPFTDHVLEFDLDKGDVARLVKASTVMTVSDVQIHNENDKIMITVHDMKNSLSNSYSIEVGDNTNGHDFKINFKMDNLKFIAGSYNVKIVWDELKFAYFKNTDVAVSYWVALEANSEFN